MLRLLVAALAAFFIVAPAASAVETGIDTAHTSLSGHPAETSAQLGADWASLTLRWEDVEPTPGVIDESFMTSVWDPYLAEFTNRNLSVLVTVVDAPPWAAKDPSAPSDSVQPPADPAHYASFLRRLAARSGWKGQVDAYEIWDAPNTAKGWAPAPNAAEYAALLKAASAAIRSADGDPAAKVISGGLAGGDVSFLAGLYDAGLTGDHVDGIGVQMKTPCRVDMPSAYYREADGRIGVNAFTGYRELHQESVERGAAEPIWMTEFGISNQTSTCAEGPGAGSRPAGVSTEQQAQFLREAYSCMAADTFMGPALWYSLQDTGTDAARSDHFMGLLGIDNVQKPAASAFSALGSGITPNPACGGRVDTVSPSVAVEAAPTFTGSLPIKLTATDAETPVGRTYLTIRKATDPAEAQVQIPGGGQGGSYTLDWQAAKDLPLGVPHVLTGYAYDEAKNLGGASVTVQRVAPALPGAPAVVKIATSSSIDVASKKGRRAIAAGTLTYKLPEGSALKGRGKLVFEYFQKGKGRKKSKWVTTSRFTILQSALRRGRLNRTTGKRTATFTKAAKLAGKAVKWRAVFEFEGLDPFQDSRAMTQFKAKG